MREIGGYLELERRKGKRFHDNVIALDCGRSCLMYLVELRGIKKVIIPDYMCSSVEELFLKVGISVRKYAVTNEMLPDGDSLVNTDEWVILVDYYGLLTSEVVSRFSSLSGGRLIVDETEGFFRPAWKNADTFWSCRKWFGVPDGAYLHTKDNARLNRRIPTVKSAEWMNHILGRSEDVASAHLDEFRMNESRLTGFPMQRMSVISESLLSVVDYETVRKARVNNWAIVEHRLGSYNLLRLEVPEVPFMYPLLVDDARGVREALASRGIYIPTLWPNVICDGDAGLDAKNLAFNILPLPVDQRYDEHDMIYMSRLVQDVLYERTNHEY